MCAISHVLSVFCRAAAAGGSGAGRHVRRLHRRCAAGAVHAAPAHRPQPAQVGVLRGPHQPAPGCRADGSHRSLLSGGLVSRQQTPPSRSSFRAGDGPVWIPASVPAAAWWGRTLGAKAARWRCWLQHLVPSGCCRVPASKVSAPIEQQRSTKSPALLAVEQREPLPGRLEAR